MTHHHHLVV